MNQFVQPLHSSSFLKPGQVRQLARQEAILKAALHLFASRGYYGTAVPDIAKLAAVGTGTIYRYFADKEDLANAVLLHSLNCMKSVLTYDDLAAFPTVRQMFGTFWMRLIDFALEYPDEFRFLELQDHVSYRSAEVEALDRELMMPIWFFFNLCRQAGIARDQSAELTTALVWGVFTSLFKSSYAGYYALNEQQYLQAEQNAWDVFSNGHDGLVSPEVLFQS